MEPRKPYPTDLTDQEWALIASYVPTAKSGGRPEKYPKWEILNGIFYILRGGCVWRLLPHDFPLSGVGFFRQPYHDTLPLE
jgi:putative transposase